MKYLAISSAVLFAVSAFAAPKVEVAAALSGAPAVEADTAMAKPASGEFGLARVTTKPEQKAVIEIIKEHRYPTAGGASPTKFETRNVGATLEITTHLGADGLITFDGCLSVVRLANTVAPAQNPHSLSASTMIARETSFTGRARSGELVTIDVGERGRDFGQLKLTLRLIGE